MLDWLEIGYWVSFEAEVLYEGAKNVSYVPR